MLLLGAVATGEEPQSEDPKTPARDWVEELVEKARPSIVVITVTGRDGQREGMGTGFVVSPEGLIATNLHVIGDARPIGVRTVEGKTLEVTAVEATDRDVDLAVLRVKAAQLPALELADSDRLKQGQNVIALGNPLGLEHSVVAGVISGDREIGGQSMIQLAIPVERGNSGGPLLDADGRVVGVMTLKSQVTANLGFAAKINQLKPLLKKPNPVPMSRWLTIGALDPKEWTPVGGGLWRQRAGRITVSGAGQGFGGRALCLAQAEVPELPFELAVSVKLDDESGAAGLAFAADGGDRHYGFYPSNGRLRLSRFDGPDVTSWNVLSEQPSEHYRRGDWNTLKVRVEKDRIRCWVNDELVIESADQELREGRAGLAKFRNTAAEFKGFRLGRELPASAVPEAVSARIEKSLESLPATGHAPTALVEQLTADAAASTAALRARAKALDEQAVRLRRLAETVHRRGVIADLARTLSGKEDEIDLLQAALLVARLDNEELDVAAYCQDLERMARELKHSLAKDADEPARLRALNNYLFAENGFHGSRHDYYNRSNSYLNEVLDDREGLPITLSIVYMELGRRIGLKIVGVGLPGHFLVRHEPAAGESTLIDVFEGGLVLTRAQVGERLLNQSGINLRDEHLATVTKARIIDRMLHNLLGVAQQEQDAAAMLRYVDAIVTLSPNSAAERMMRAVMFRHFGQRDEALDDVNWILEHAPEEIDLERVRQLKELLEERAD